MFFLGYRLLYFKSSYQSILPQIKNFLNKIFQKKVLSKKNIQVLLPGNLAIQQSPGNPGNLEIRIKDGKKSLIYRDILGAEDSRLTHMSSWCDLHFVRNEQNK